MLLSPNKTYDDRLIGFSDQFKNQNNCLWPYIYFQGSIVAYNMHNLLNKNLYHKLLVVILINTAVQRQRLSFVCTILYKEPLVMSKQVMLDNQ